MLKISHPNSLAKGGKVLKVHAKPNSTKVWRVLSRLISTVLINDRNSFSTKRLLQTYFWYYLSPTRGHEINGFHSI